MQVLLHCCRIMSSYNTNPKPLNCCTASLSHCVSLEQMLFYFHLCTSVSLHCFAIHRNISPSMHCCVGLLHTFSFASSQPRCFVPLVHSSVTTSLCPSISLSFHTYFFFDLPFPRPSDLLLLHLPSDFFRYTPITISLILQLSEVPSLRACNSSPIYFLVQLLIYSPH